jgi:Uma2 family endonuclease
MAHDVSLDRPPPEPMTVEEWADLPEDTEGELVDGRLVEEEMPDAIHETVVSEFIVALSTWVKPRNGRVYGSELKFRIRPRRGRKADLSLYLSGRRPEPRGAVRTQPDVMIEVVSPRPRDGRRDRVEKVEDYAEVKVRYYWILDPELRTLEILELGADGRYARALGASEGRVQIPGCEGLILDLDELWKEIDRLLSPSAADPVED